MSKERYKEKLKNILGLISDKQNYGHLVYMLAEICADGVMQLTRIADSMEKVANPMLKVSNMPIPNTCFNCGMPHDISAGKDWKYYDFCSDKCIMELGEKLSNKQPCQDCCSAAGENITKENKDENDN